MRKLILLTLFAAPLIFMLKLTAYSNKEGYLVHDPDVIDRIETKYDELSKNASVVKAKGIAVAKSLRFIQESDKVTKDYSKLRQIALVRHGEPDIVKTGKFSCKEACEFVKCYDNVCIIIPEKPFFDISKDRAQIKFFSSPIQRAVSTANYLCGKNQDVTINPVFREFETSIPKVNSNKKLPIKWWTAIARIKWMLGVDKDKNIETFAQAKARAKEAAQLLSNSATESHPKVLLTAHGMQNRYIRKNLKAMGWKVVEDTGNDYFGTTILVKVDE